MKKYSLETWVSPKLKVKNSPLCGKGIFAIAAINEGEIVTIWGGTLMSDDEGKRANLRPQSVSYVGEHQILADFVEDKDSLDNYLNHSCDPNLWMNDEITLSARRNITPGEEITIDYAMFEGDEGYISEWECQCGSPLCRGRVTGQNWRFPELQERYKNHFSPFLNERIKRNN